MYLTYDLPIGEPMSGIAYGDKDKSKAFGMVLGIVASVATMGAAMPIIAEGTLASQLAGGAMMAGGVLNGVGTITGNKKLTKIGGILSLAGGVGALGIKGADALGIGGSITSAKGSDALATFANNSMSSINDAFGANIYDVSKSAAGQLDTMSSSNAGQLDTAGQTTPLPNQQLAVGTDIPTGNGVLDLSTSAVPGPTGVSTGTSNALVGGGNAPGVIGRTLGVLNNNAGLAKVGLDALAAFAGPGLPDQQAYVDALTAKSTTANDLATFQLENLKRQTQEISEADPNFAAKVAAAKANNIKYNVIPVYGNGILNKPNGQGAQNIATNIPVTQPTFNTQINPQAIS